MIGSLVTRGVIRSGFAALNRGDLDALMAHWAEDCRLYYPGRVAAGGLHEGKAAVTRWFERFFDQFPKRHYVVHHIGLARLFDMTGNNIAFAHFSLDLVNKDGRPSTNGGVSIFTIRNRKAIAEEIFLRTIDGEAYRRDWGDIA